MGSAWKWLRDSAGRGRVDGEAVFMRAELEPNATGHIAVPWAMPAQELQEAGATKSPLLSTSSLPVSITARQQEGVGDSGI